MNQHPPTTGIGPIGAGAGGAAGAPGSVPSVSIAGLALWTGGAAIVAGLLATAALLPSGHAAGSGSGLAVGCVLAGVAAQLVAGASLRPRSGSSWAMLALFGHGVRLSVSLSLGLWSMMVFAPDRVGFWAVFLAASLAAIVAEAALIVAASRRVPICVVGSGAHR